MMHLKVKYPTKIGKVDILWVDQKTGYKGSIKSKHGWMTKERVHMLNNLELEFDLRVVFEERRHVYQIA